jgi:hypothetical protein
MTFGPTVITSEESTEELQRQAEVYIRALRIMLRLIFDYDLWALKASTLMVSAILQFPPSPVIPQLSAVGICFCGGTATQPSMILESFNYG